MFHFLPGYKGDGVSCTSTGKASIAIEPEAAGAGLLQAAAAPQLTDPAVHMVNATPDTITSVQCTQLGEKIELLGEIAAYSMATVPEYVMGLHQWPEKLTGLSVAAYPLTVNFKQGPSFTISLNLSAALHGTTYLTFYLMSRGIMVTNDQGAPRAVSWI